MNPSSGPVQGAAQASLAEFCRCHRRILRRCVRSEVDRGSVFTVTLPPVSLCAGPESAFRCYLERTG